MTYWPTYIVQLFLAYVCFWHLFDTETDPCVGVFVWHTKCHWFLYWHVFHISVKILSMEKNKTNCYNLPVGRILKKYAPCHCQFVTSFVAWNLQLIRQTFTGAPGGKGRHLDGSREKLKNSHAMASHLNLPSHVGFRPCQRNVYLTAWFVDFRGGGIASRSTVKHPIVTFVHKHRVSQKYLFPTWNELMHPERCRWFSKSWTFEPMAWRAALCHPLSKAQLLWIARKIRRNWFH